jgi:hypothetical protein
MALIHDEYGHFEGVVTAPDHDRFTPASDKWPAALLIHSCLRQCAAIASQHLTPRHVQYALFCLTGADVGHV